MNSLEKTVSVIKSNILPYVIPKHKGLFEFGLQALSLRSFKTLNSNARKTIANRNTAQSKIYRLVKNPKLINNFHYILHNLTLVKKSSLVNIDFSTFCGFETLGFGVQTGYGRAIPVWADCITYPIEEATSQNIFIIDQIKEFGKTLGFYPRFVFDRGFMIPSLVEFMLKANIIFYIRIKAGKHVKLRKDDKKGVPAEEVESNTKIIHAYKTKLRIIRSDKPANENQPWYILTNDFKTPRDKIIKIYYYRFEIEEVFKDMKHIFDMNKLWIKKKQTFRVLLWFVIIAFWIAYLTGIIKSYLQAKTHIKKRLSWVKLWFEDFEREIKNIAFTKAGWTPG
jgi:large-conductance mechanosensitive channel